MFKLGKGTKRAAVVGLAACAVLFASAYPRDGQASKLLATAPSLGAAASFAVLGGSTVTNTGPTTVTGDLGVWPGSAVTGFPPGTVIGGTIHAGDAAAQQAQDAVTTAYNSLAGQACDADLTGQDLGGQTLTPGVYCFSSSAQLTGPLTLNAQGNANAVWIFKMGSTLTTASGSSVLVINGGSPCNVFWQVGSSATLGTTTTFAGNILALQSITLATGADVSGRALARNGAVTLDTNDVSSSGCVAPAATPTATVVAVTPTATPPATPTTVAAATATPPTAATPTATSTATPTATLTPATSNGDGAAATATTVAAATATTAAAATATTVAAATATAVAPSPTAISIEEAAVTATPSPRPAALPSTGDSLPWAGPLALLLGGALLLMAGLAMRRARG